MAQAALVTQMAGAGKTGTAYDNQRKTGRLPNNGLLDMVVDGTTVNFFFSKDGGTTWAAVATGSITSVTHASLFTDETDGFIHVARVNGSSREYLRGVPTYDGSGVLTAITWTNVNPFGNTTTGSWGKPDLVVHKEGTGWRAHVVAFNTDGVIKYQCVNIAAAGTLTVPATEITLNGTISTTSDAPSIAVDLNKNLSVSWHAGAIGAGKGVRFRMAAYATGAWTWQTEEPITEALFAEFMGPCLVDRAGRAVVALRDNATGKALKVYRRAAAGGWSDLSPAGVAGSHMTVALHTNDDIYVVMTPIGGLEYRRYSGSQWSAATATPTIGGSDTFPSACRYTDGFSLDIVVTTGPAAPWNIEHVRVDLPRSGAGFRRGYNVTCLGRGRRGVWSV